MTTVSFGLWLKQRRKTLDLTQGDLARCVGCAAITIQKIEADERRPSRQVAELLADCLEIPPADRPTFLKVARAELRVDRLAEVAPAPLLPLPTEPELTIETETPSPAPLPPLGVPTPSTPLIGREHELAEITQLLQHPQCRLLSLIGSGGIGKSRLAIEVASHQRQAFADGVYFVPLAPVSAGEFIVPAIADAIGFSFSGPTDPQVQLLTYLREKRLLLVLDNLEHLLPAPHPFFGEEKGQGIAVITHLLQHAPAIKWLTTSRERLNVQGEWVFEIQGLPVPPSNQTHELEEYSAALLFLQSAQRARVGFVLPPEERPAVAQICRLMEGMPLGIELAAAWVRVLSCPEIAQEIERNLDFLAGSVRDMPERHRSLRAVFDHSWKLLSAEEQQVMRRLSVFRGGFRREAAEQVAGATLPLLSALVDKSLLHRTEAGRYNLHELVQQYATAILQEDVYEAEQVRERHSTYYAALLHQWESQLKSSQQPEVLVAMGLEIDNLRPAWAWIVKHQQVADIQKSLHALWLFYEVRGRFREGVSLFEQAVEVLSASSTDKEIPDGRLMVALGQLLARQAWFHFRLGQYLLARDLLKQSLAWLSDHSDQAALADTLVYLGIVEYNWGDYVQAIQHEQESLGLSQALDDPWRMAVCLHSLGNPYLAQGENQKAYRLISQALALWRSIGDTRQMAYCLLMLGRAASRLGQHAEAQRVLEEGLEVSRRLKYHWGVGNCLLLLGLIALNTGQPKRAEGLFHESLALFKKMGEPLCLAQVFNGLGAASHTLGAYPEAKHYFLTALQLAIEAPVFPVVLEALLGIATVFIAQDEAPDRVMELLAHVLHHPASSQETKDRAEGLRAELASVPAQQQVEAAQAQTQAKSIEALVQELLDHP